MQSSPLFLDRARRCCRVLCAVVALLFLPLAAPAQESDQRVRAVPIPSQDLGADLLELRGLAQRGTVGQFDVFYDFRFTDQLERSGIRFQHHITPDSGKIYQPNHYDHGSGIVVADVDSDGLLDLYFVTQLGRNEMWRNLGNGKFEDITDRAGVALAEQVGVTAAFADYDNDGDPDLYVTSVRTGNVLFRNDGRGAFEDVTAAAGLVHSGHSSGAVFFDYDRDGFLDLFLTNVGVYTVDQKHPAGHWLGIGWAARSAISAFDGHLVTERTEYSILYRNLGNGGFQNVSAAVGLQDGGWSGDAAFTDFDEDGWPDLYVLNMQGDDHYWKNLAGRRFEERTAEHFPMTPWGTMGIKFFDWDNSGTQDLILTDMHSDMSRKVSPGYEKLKSFITMTAEQLQGGDNNIFGNAFYDNQGDAGWVERSDELGTENYWPWGLSVADLNADGWQDVFVTSSMNFPFRYGVNTLLLNNRGEHFLDSEFLVGIEPRELMKKRPWYSAENPWTATKMPWFSVDCSQSDGQAHPMCRGESGDRITVFANVGSRSSVVFDLDGDGDLDIITNEFNDFPQVLVSDLATRRSIHFLQIELVGKESNRDGLGAWVRVSAGDQTFTRYHDGKSGYLSQSAMPLYFGLPADAAATRVEVRWPSGKTQVIDSGIPRNGTLTVSEN